MPSVLSLPAAAGEVLALFGDGTHPAARLAVTLVGEAIAGFRDVSRGRSPRVLDVGAGLGTAARAAVTAGAEEVVALAPSREVAAALSATAPGARVVVAHLADYLASEAGGAFDVVVARLSAEQLGVLAPLLAAAIRPGGTLVVTGFLSSDVDAAAGSLAAEALRTFPARGDGGWAAVIARA